MDTGQRRLSKLLVIVLFVAFATIAVSKFVLAAPHITPSLIGYRGSLRLLERYLAAPNQGDQKRIWIHGAESLDDRMRKLDRFGQYLAALEMMEQERAAALGARETVKHRNSVRLDRHIETLKRASR